MVVPPKHPKMIIFSRKTNGCWVPPFRETPISPVFNFSQPVFLVVVGKDGKTVLSIELGRPKRQSKVRSDPGKTKNLKCGVITPYTNWPEILVINWGYI